MPAGDTLAGEVDAAIGLHARGHERKAAVLREVTYRLQIASRAEQRLAAPLQLQQAVDQRDVRFIGGKLGVRIEPPMFRRHAEVRANRFTELQDLFDSWDRLRRDHGVQGKIEP